MRKKIGILGGAFDPIHKGHILIGQHALDTLDLDEIWVLPNGNPPHKTITNSTKYNQHRINMIGLVLENMNKFTINTHEIDSTKSSCYSYETFEDFSKIYPEYDFNFIIGSDSLLSLEQWHKPEVLLRYCNIIAFNRHKMGYGELKDKAMELRTKFHADIEIIESDILDISSSEIREAIRLNEDLESYLDEKVIAYINENKLYQDD